MRPADPLRHLVSQALIGPPGDGGQDQAGALGLGRPAQGPLLQPCRVGAVDRGHGADAAFKPTGLSRR